MGFLYACALALLIFSNPTINAESQPPIGFQVNILIQSPKTNKQTTVKKKIENFLIKRALVVEGVFHL